MLFSSVLSVMFQWQCQRILPGALSALGQLCANPVRMLPAPC